ncbi:MAG TPA: DUF1571 domain-containing protein [Gemmataceae bacterium]|nr:DUF1571 domain-containing protein [Gemmataceae bacterium]
MTRKLVWGWVVAASVAGVALAQPPIPKASDPTPPKAEPPAATPNAVQTADPLGALLADGKAAYAKVRDYTCTFTRQERVNGVLPPEQVAEMKVRVQPASVYVRFARPEAVAGLEVCYVSTRVDGKLRWRPAGPKGANGFQTLSPDDSKVRADFHRPVAELGIGPIFELLSGIAAREKVLNNPVEVFTSEYQFAGRNVTRYEIFTRRPHAHRYAYRMLVYVDKESKLPVRLEAYDAPKPGLSAGDLLEAYSYSDIKLNVGLGDSAFNY